LLRPVFEFADSRVKDQTAFLVRHWAKLSVLGVVVAVATMALVAMRPRDPNPAPIEGREWGTVKALITPDKGEFIRYLGERLSYAL
jgi:hypothetical protein